MFLKERVSASVCNLLIGKSLIYIQVMAGLSDVGHRRGESHTCILRGTGATSRRCILTGRTHVHPSGDRRYKQKVHSDGQDSRASFRGQALQAEGAF